MVRGGNDIAADAGFTKRTRKRSCETNCLKIGVNLERDPGGTKQDGLFFFDGFGFRGDEGDPFGLSESRQRRSRTQVRFMRHRLCQSKPGAHLFI